jgi:hypothetical protein
MLVPSLKTAPPHSWTNPRSNNLLCRPAPTFRGLIQPPGGKGPGLTKATRAPHPLFPVGQMILTWSVRMFCPPLSRAVGQWVGGRVPGMQDAMEYWWESFPRQRGEVRALPKF